MIGSKSGVDERQAERFARLAIRCIQREYPNKISHSLRSSEDVKSPRQLTPAFFGCYDWHSAVHNHWTLARLLRLSPNGLFAPEARQVLSESLTKENIAGEVSYVESEGREAFERPYGLAWLLQLAGELKEWDTDHARGWSVALAPLESLVASRLVTWLPKLSRPVRAGEHSNTAFALGLMMDYAGKGGNAGFGRLIDKRARAFYLNDVNCPISYEPSGEDFLSPCVAEADLVRRILPPAEFASWLTQFLPEINLQPIPVLDDTDGKLAHLIGLNLSRAWMLVGIASGLPRDDSRKRGLLELAEQMKQAGLARIDDDKYQSGHWLGSFAVYLLTIGSLDQGEFAGF